MNILCALYKTLWNFINTTETQLTIVSENLKIEIKLEKSENRNYKIFITNIGLIKISKT